MSRRISCATAFVLFCICPIASGAIVLNFDQPNYNVTPGSTISVDLVLTETAGTALSTDGVAIFALEVGFAPASGTTDHAEIMVDSDISANPLFDYAPLTPSSVTVPGSTAVVAGEADIFGSPASPPVTGTSVTLGTVTFTAGTVVGEVTDLVLRDFDATLVDFTSGTGAGLDGMISFGSTATITTVPEPSAVLFLAFLSIGCASRNWLQARQVTAEIR